MTSNWMSSAQLESRIKKQVDAIERIINVKFRARILDLGCGAGDQTIELARRRYRIVGMDSSAQALSEARQRARAEKLTVHFVTSQKYRIPYEAEFNAVINLRNPIGASSRERDDAECLQSVHDSLRPGGVVLLDLFNREKLIRDLGAHSRVFDLVKGLLDCGHYRPRGGESPVPAGRIRIYSLTEIIRLLHAARLKFKSVWGDYGGRPYGLDSRRMILLAEKMPPIKMERAETDDGLVRAVRIKGRPR